MLEFLTAQSEDAISILKADHEKVKGLFDQFKDAKSLAAKRKIAAEAIRELKIHAAIEEELFYPAVRKPIGKKVMNEADEEHHVAKVLIAELEIMTGKEDHYDAKFTVLAENVRPHIREEESDMLPKAKHLSVNMETLGRKMLARKQQLMKNGVAVFAEEKMVGGRKGRGDSPAKAAHKDKPATKRISKAASKHIPKHLNGRAARDSHVS